MSGRRDTCRLVRTLCRLRAMAKAAGHLEMTHERRCARLVLQGVLTRQEAEDALTLLLCGIYKVEAPDAAWLSQACERLSRAMELAQLERHRCEREMKAGCQADIAAHAASTDMLARARAINADHGRPFVWPEVRELVREQLTWAMTQRVPRSAGAHSHG